MKAIKFAFGAVVAGLLLLVLAGAAASLRRGGSGSPETSRTGEPVRPVSLRLPGGSGAHEHTAGQKCCGHDHAH